MTNKLLKPREVDLKNYPINKLDSYCRLTGAIVQKVFMERIGKANFDGLSFAVYRKDFRIFPTISTYYKDQYNVKAGILQLCPCCHIALPIELHTYKGEVENICYDCEETVNNFVNWR